VEEGLDAGTGGGGLQAVVGHFEDGDVVVVGLGGLQHPGNHFVYLSKGHRG
jgi:hypothetical protein